MKYLTPMLATMGEHQRSTYTKSNKIKLGTCGCLNGNFYDFTITQAIQVELTLSCVQEIIWEETSLSMTSIKG